MDSNIFQEKRALQALIGKDVSIEHIGSTAIPNLMSKPTMDILIGVIEFNEQSFLFKKSRHLAII